MLLLYLDDSGSPGNQNERYFVLGGICVPEGSARWLTHELDKLAEKIYPENPQIVEFHAAEIFSGKKLPWSQFREKKQRIQIILDVLYVLERAYSDIVLFAYAVHKSSFPNEDPVVKAYEDLASRFNKYIERDAGNVASPQHGLIILDKTSYETGLQNLALSIRRSGNRWGQQLRGLVEVPLFVDSVASRITQLADHIAYAVFRRYEANDLTYFNCIENRFYKKDGIIHGLVHRQTVNKECTCPACITRR